MWDQQQRYQIFLNHVRTYFPEFFGIIPAVLPTQAAQVQTQGQVVQPNAAPQVQEICFMTKEQIEAYVPKSYKPVALWDQDSNIIYLVRLDGPGRTVRETLKWEPCQLQETPPQDNGQFARKEDLAALSGRLDSLIAALQGQNAATQEGTAHE